VIRILIDTTVLCGAIRSHRGVDMRLLMLARLGFYEPVITQEIVAEWVGKCRSGFGKPRIQYPPEIVEEFCDLLVPLLSPEMIRNVALGRAGGPLNPILKKGGKTIIQVPARQAHSGTAAIGGDTLALKDISDLHVIQAAIQYGCRYLCTYNKKDFPEGLSFGEVRFVAPERLVGLLTGGSA